MNKHFQKAETLLKEVVGGLIYILGKDGEDISYFNPQAVDPCIDKLIQVRCHMTLGRKEDECAQ
jgi:hypothetical protein